MDTVCATERKKKGQRERKNHPSAFDRRAVLQKVDFLFFEDKKQKKYGSKK
jgi:hypothetical protein